MSFCLEKKESSILMAISPNSKNAIYLSVFGILSVVLVKSIIRERRDAKFNPHARDAPANRSDVDYYENLAQVKPGFPLPSDASSQERKSEFEGAGLSYLSRKRGDKLGFLDRRSEK